MPSPFGYKRSASSYYQHGGVAQHYNYNWDGLPPCPTRAAESRALGGCDCGPDCDCGGDYIDVTATFHKSLGSDYPVAASMYAGRRSILHSGPEQTHIYDGLGLFEGFSRNEKRLAVVAGAGLIGFLVWKQMQKGKR